MTEAEVVNDGVNCWVALSLFSCNSRITFAGQEVSVALAVTEIGAMVEDRRTSRK